MNKVKKGDEVIAIAGKNKGKTGKVLRVVMLNGRVHKVLVEGVNLVKKHLRANPQRNQVGGIIEREAPLPISNVAMYNPATGKADKVGFKFLEDGTKVRYFKSNNELIDK